MSSQSDQNWDPFIKEYEDLKRTIGRSFAVNVSSSNLRDATKSLVQHYFRKARPDLLLIGLDRNILSEVDSLMQNLFRLSMRSNRRTSYQNTFKDTDRLLETVSISREMLFSDIVFSEAGPTSIEMTEHEKLIYESLKNLVPSAGRSYRQAILDLSDETRLSYRGAANELREAIREVLDHLAPDEDVIAEPGFKLEKGAEKPTRKQKARHILKARGLSRSVSKVPEGMIEAIEVKVAVVVSSTYTRINLATHVQTERLEVQRLKRYVDAVLSELLSIPA